MKRERAPEGRYKAVAALAALLVHGNRSVDELVLLTGMHTNTVALWCSALHRAGVCHIAGWRQDTAGRWSIRIFKLGPGRDMPCPLPTSAQGIARRKAQEAAARKAAPPPVRATTCWQESSPYRENAARH